MKKNIREKNIKGEKELNKLLKLIARTSVIVLVGLILSKILGYLFRIIIARYYGPEIYGLFILAFSMIIFFAAIASFGFTEGLLRFIPLLRGKKKIDEIRYLIKKITKIYIISGVIFSGIIILLSDLISVGIFHNHSLSLLLKVLGLIMIFSLLMGIYITTIRAFEEIGWYSFVYNIFQNVIKVLILIIIIFLGIKSGEFAVGVSLVLGTCMTFLMSYIVCKIKIKKIFGKYKKKDYSSLRREFFNYSWPIIFYSLISIIFYWIDTFSLGYYKSVIEVGLYNAAVPIALLLGFVPELFMQLFFPLINKEYSNKNYEVIKQLSKQVTKWIFIVVLPIFVLLFLFPGAAINIFFGSQYLPAQGALRLLLIGTLISAISITSMQLVSMMGRSKLVLMNIVTASIINLILNSILVPLPAILSFDNSNGLIGAALATLISLMIFNLLFVIEIKKFLSFFAFKRKMIDITLISIIPILILFYLKSKVEINILSIIMLSCLFFFIYFILILLFKAFDKNDWNVINAILNKLRNIKNKIS